MRWLLGAIGVTAACGGGTAAVPVIGSPAAGSATTVAAPATKLPGLPALARADVVAVFASGEVVAYAAGGERLQELGRTRFVAADPKIAEPYDFASAYWIDRAHLGVVFGPEDDRAAVIDASGVTPLALLDASRFDGIPAPAPEGGGDGPTRGGAQYASIDAGALVWHACVWGYAYDEGMCVTWASVRLWPPGRADVVVDEHGPARPLLESDDDRFVDAPAAFAVTADAQGHAQCAAGPKQLAPMPGASVGSSFGDVHWLANAGHPSAALVTYEGFGATVSYKSDFAVFDRCGGAPVIVGRSARRLSGQLWIGDEWPGTRAPGDGEDQPPTVRRLHRGLATLAELPGAVAVIARPEK